LGAGVVETTAGNITGTGRLSITSTTATSTFSTGGLTVGTSQFVVQQTSGNVGIGTTTPTEQFSVASRMFIGGTGTSTIASNLYVMGTLRATVSYVGDLIFDNMFRFTELSASTTAPLYLRNAAGDDVLSFYQDGNIGIGTSTTSYKLNVGGEIGVMGFINISSEEAKKEITFLNNEDEDEILRKIASTSVATYLYENECDTNILMHTNDANNTNVDSYNSHEFVDSHRVCGKRLGLIAEEAPLEILSVDGKGVDLYKMISFLWVGVKVQERKIADLELRIENLENLAASSTVPSQTDSNALFSLFTPLERIDFLTGFTGFLRDIYELAIEKGFLKIAQIVTDKLTTKELCVEDVCITKDQLKILLEKNGMMPVAQSAAADSAPAPEQEPVPVSEPEPGPASEPAPEPAPTEIPTE
jgi:hypothetical protein